jgi:hypothetical protein
MKNFAEEFRNLSSFYTKLAEDLAKIPIADDSKDGSAFVKSTLQKRELLEQIPGMDSRISQLSDDWTKCRAKLDPATQNRADEMAADAKSQAARLQELCRIHTQKLQAIHNEIRNNLVELAKGARFAKVLKPIQHNYPKFIDSSY